MCLDKDGYPTEEYLESIRNKNFNDRLEVKAFLDEEIKPYWKYAEVGYWRVKKGRDICNKPCLKYHLSTAGWSGNEDIIDALEGTFFWYLSWEQTRRGGHYIFEVKIPEEKEQNTPK